MDTLDNRASCAAAAISGYLGLKWNLKVYLHHQGKPRHHSTRVWVDTDRLYLFLTSAMSSSPLGNTDLSMYGVSS